LRGNGWRVNSGDVGDQLLIDIILSRSIVIASQKKQSLRVMSGMRADASGDRRKALFAT
jgi:hypothetical protein